jgi:hypothetical protein
VKQRSVEDSAITHDLHANRLFRAAIAQIERFEVAKTVMQLMGGRALILGGAKCLDEDLAALEAMVGPWRGVTLAVNRAALRYPDRTDHWVCMHADEIPASLAQWPARLPRPLIWTREGQPYAQNADLVAPHWKGTSGLLAVSVAFVLGAEKIVLCGVPMDSQPHFDDAEPWHACATFWRDWTAKLREMRGRVTSMSGRTEEWLGRPDPEWLGLEAIA